MVLSLGWVQLECSELSSWALSERWEARGRSLCREDINRSTAVVVILIVIVEENLS